MKKSYITISLIIMMSVLVSACGVAPLANLSGNIVDQVDQSIDRINEEIDMEDNSVKESMTSQSPKEDKPAPPAQAPVDPTVIAAYENVLTSVYEYVNPSVVNIRVKVDGISSGFDFGGLPELPFAHPELPGLPDNSKPPEGGEPMFPEFSYGMGSGFVWDTDGHIVTNHHVVDGAEEIEVIFSDGSTVQAELVGADPYSDLAVIKVDRPAESLKPIELADSDAVKVGELAIAIGNPFGLDGTMTVGIISALGRTLPANEGFGLGFSIPDVIQTDAPINPGNSGGVLVDDQGLLIGVPTAIESPVSANAGIGFAVPSNTVWKVVPVLIEDGSFQHAYLGITGTTLVTEMAEVMDLDPLQRGALVTSVVPNGPADEAGLRGSEQQVDIDGQQVPSGGDVIIAIDGTSISGMDDLIEHLNGQTSVGQEVSLTILRDGDEISVKVTLGARPARADLIEEQKPQVSQAKPWLGIRGKTLNEEIAVSIGLPADQNGVYVDQVQISSPAMQAGMLDGDVIVELDGETIASIEDLVVKLAEYEPGDTVRLTILRGGDESSITVTLGEASE